MSATQEDPFSLAGQVALITGGGTGLVAMWKAFGEMEAMGWIGPERLP